MKARLMSLLVTCLVPIALSAAELQDVAAEKDAAMAKYEEYVRSMVERITSRAVYPDGAEGQRCIARVTQSREGEVIDVRIKQCDSRKLQEAVFAAAFRASPLPLPKDPSFFNPNLEITFVVPRRK